MQMFVGSFVGRRCLCLGFVLINVFAVLSLGRNAVSRGPALGTYLLILYFILLSLYGVLCSIIRIIERKRVVLYNIRRTTTAAELKR